MGTVFLLVLFARKFCCRKKKEEEENERTGWRDNTKIGEISIFRMKSNR